MSAVTPSSGDLDPDLVEAWLRLALPALDVRTRWFQIAEEVGLSPAGLDALLKVDPNQPPSMRDVAELLGCDASYVTAMVDDLERAEYARRRPAATDRRVKIVELTPAGRRAQLRAQERLMAPPARLRNLSRAQQRALAHLLRQALGES